MNKIGPESWLKISLPAIPVAFTIFGIWLYWGENPLPLLAPSLAFWGVVIFFYLFTHCYVPTKSYPLYLMVIASGFWLLSSITSHNLGKFLTSKEYTGTWSVLLNKDFRYAYICCLVDALGAVIHFFKYEPLIMAEIQAQRERIGA